MENLIQIQREIEIYIKKSFKKYSLYKQCRKEINDSLQLTNRKTDGMK